MRTDYNYDVFISFTHEDGKRVQKIYSKLTEFGLRVFWSEEKLKEERGKGFAKSIQEALIQSQHFVLYWTEKANNAPWVEKEWTTFLNNCHIPDENNRRMYVLCADPSVEKDIPLLLKDIQRPADPVGLICDIVKIVFINSEKELTSIKERQQEELIQKTKQLETEVKKGSEARDFYRHNRFWRPFTDNKHVHIFTCARNVIDDPESKRGRGGRTNIDMWDYRSVFDITHFFASMFPGTKITIEDPVSKLGGSDLKEAVRLADRIAHMRRMIEDKDCIIIGSPDVSDFAEIILAEIHKISPYSEGRDKSKGFAIIKEMQYTSSAFYWKKKGDEVEGVAEIVKPNSYKPYSNNLPTLDEGSGKTYGILVVANNPFTKTEKRNKILILSGFSGVATNAIAKIITSDECLTEFFKLDQAYRNLDRPIEALIGVQYTIDRNFLQRDTRKIENYSKDITFERLIEI